MGSPFVLSRATGWRRSAAVNTILLALLFAALVTSTFFVGEQTQSFMGNYFFYMGDCDRTKIYSLVTHLALNVVATLVFSAANFGMQILNAPTRDEVDAAHARSRSVEVGVPSLSNLFFVLSKFKVFAWLLLMVVSLPLHMLFNSAVFMTDFPGRQWNLTIAAEPFLNGADFFIPGASLAMPGFQEGYGRLVNASTLLTDASRMSLELRAIAATGTTWKRLDPAKCRKKYLKCHGGQNFKDLIVVVNTAGSTGTTQGWTRSQVFDLAPPAAAQWDRLVPSNSMNSLWFSTACEMVSKPAKGSTACTQTCANALGIHDESDITSPLNPLGGNDTWTIKFQASPNQFGDVTTGFSRAGFKFGEFNELDVQYCLAQESKPVCKLGVSPLMMGLSALCIAFIASLLLLILKNTTEDTLVTPGDAIASFITKPDPTTENMCTLTISDKVGPASRLFARKRGQTFGLEAPREWSRRTNYKGASVSPLSWFLTYAFQLWSLGVLIFSYFRFGPRNTENGRMTSLDVPEDSFYLALLFANKPHVFLSACYYNFNGLITRFFVEKEWNSYSLAYLPLRVTTPKGSQISTYRLQLPLVASIPLIVVGALLHWVLSQTFFLSIFEGNYLGNDGAGLRDVEDGIGFDATTVVALSYSVKALLILSIVSFVLAMVPLFVSFTKLKGDMVIAGASSRVISAACHVQPAGETPMALATYSPFIFKSPWVQARSSEGPRPNVPTSPSEARSPTDVRAMPMYRSRAASDAYLIEPQTPTPLLHAWPLTSPSPYEDSPSREARMSVYRPRAVSDAQMLEPPSPYQQSRPISTLYNVRSAADTRSMIAPRSRAASDAHTIVPATPRAFERTTQPGEAHDAASLSGTRDAASYRPRATSEAHSVIDPLPTPRTFEERPPSIWGQQKFEPSHEHDQEPPLPTASLDPPVAPWAGSFQEDKASPLAQTIALNEARRKQLLSGLSIVTPGSQAGRKLPWGEGDTKIEVLPTSTPATPYAQSVVSEGAFELKAEGEAEKARSRLARRKLRWGVMTSSIPPRDRSASLLGSNEPTTMRTAHLTFGTVENGVVRPEVGVVYE